MSDDCDDVIPGDGQPAGQGQFDVDYCPNERHDRPKMTPFTIYAKWLGNGKLDVTLRKEYAFVLGVILAPKGTTPHADGKLEFLVIPGRDGPMELAFAIGYAARLNSEKMVWTATPCDNDT